MPAYETTVEISALPATVWAATVDVEAWPTWSATTDTVRRQEPGPIRPGSTAIVIQPKLRPATWTVREALRDETFVWDTTGPGYVVTARHEIRPRGDGSSLRLQVVMSGPMSRVVWWVTGGVVRRYLDLEADGLKRFCENRA
jgi:Polyketide cyclase / dehydrase and lipid transport